MKFYTDPWLPNTRYEVNQGVYITNYTDIQAYGLQHWRCTTAHTSGNSIDYTKFTALLPTDTWFSQARNTIYSQNYFAIDAVTLVIPGLDNVINDASILRFCSGGIDLIGDAATWTAQGDFLGFSTVAEDFDIKVGRFDITLSGVSSGLANRFSKGIDFEGCRVTLEKVLLDYDTLTLIDNPGIILFDGVIFNVKIVESAVTCTITVECATLWADFERTKGRKTNNESNWLFQQGNKSDLCFSKSSTVGQVEFKWGKV
jgi:hypothetical protein